MLADFRSSVEILFLRWENLKPKLVFLINKDIFQCRVEVSAMKLPWEIYPGGGSQAVPQTLLK